jgi:hypothetical protein
MPQTIWGIAPLPPTPFSFLFSRKKKNNSRYQFSPSSLLPVTLPCERSLAFDWNRHELTCRYERSFACCVWALKSTVCVYVNIPQIQCTHTHTHTHTCLCEILMLSEWASLVCNCIFLCETCSYCVREHGLCVTERSGMMTVMVIYPSYYMKHIHTAWEIMVCVWQNEAEW